MLVKNYEKNNWTNWHHLFHKEILNDAEFIPNGAKLLIAVSGGQDSMTLLNLINDLKSHHNWSINVWHGDHNWHEKSKEYALSLKNYCMQKNIPFYLDCAKKIDINSEEKARNWRYKKLNERANKLLIQKQTKNKIYLLTGHTSTDNAETFLLNLSRGSNYAGLSHIEKKRQLDDQFFLIRPILIFSREDTKQFCNIMNIPFWEDPTNSNIKIKRNLIRKKIMPVLESIYPGCANRINNFSEKMRKYNNEQKDLSDLAYLSCQDEKGIKRDLLNSLCIEARSTILNKFIKKHCIKQISSNNMKALAFSILEKDCGKLNLPEGLKIIWDKKYINLKKN